MPPWTFSALDRSWISERIGALGICGSGSFVISAAKIDPRIKAIATVSMYDMGAANRNGLARRHALNNDSRSCSEAAQQRDAEFQGGATRYTGGTPLKLTDNAVRRVLRLLPHPAWRVTPAGASAHHHACRR